MNIPNDVYGGREPDDRANLLTAVSSILGQIEWIEGMEFYLGFFNEIPQDFSDNLTRMKGDLLIAKQYLDTYIKRVQR